MFLKNWYSNYKELEKENEYYTRECCKKEGRIREANKKIKELEKKTEDQEKLITELKKLIPVKRGRGRPRKEVKND